jgi:hypothetical protein
LTERGRRRAESIRTQNKIYIRRERGVGKVFPGSVARPPQSWGCDSPMLIKH